MDARTEILENNPNEWGEHMGLQAAAIFYDVDIEVAIKTRTRQVYVDQVYSYNRNGRRSKNAKKCNRLVYYDGRSHFQIAQKAKTLNRNCIYSYAGQCACVPVLVYCVILCTIIAYFIKIDKKKVLYYVPSLPIS